MIGDASHGFVFDNRLVQMLRMVMQAVFESEVEGAVRTGVLLACAIAKQLSKVLAVIDAFEMR